MNWDVMLLLPWAVVLGIMYWDLFMNPVALFEEISDNDKTIGNVSKRSNQTSQPVHQTESQSQAMEEDLVARQRNI